MDAVGKAPKQRGFLIIICNKYNQTESKRMRDSFNQYMHTAFLEGTNPPHRLNFCPAYNKLVDFSRF